MNEEEVVYIVGAARTPIGSFNGSLASVPAAELGSVAIREALARASVKADQVDEVIIGQILTAGPPKPPKKLICFFLPS